MPKREWTRVTREKPCPACGKPDFCAWSRKSLLKCERATEPPPGMIRVSLKDGGALFRSDSGAKNYNHNGRPQPVGLSNRRASQTVKLDIGRKYGEFRNAITPARIKELATALNVKAESLEAIGIGWASRKELKELKASGQDWSDKYPDGAYVFPERDGNGKIVGLSLRTVDGRKGCPSSSVGSRRALIVPSTIFDAAAKSPNDGEGVILLVEGASDVAACETLQLKSVGRPSNASGSDDAAKLLKSHAVIVVGENDQKADGAWPGRDGAEKVASRLATAWRRKVPWSLPPKDVKDIRSYLRARIESGLDVADTEACRIAGEELLETLATSTEQAEPEKGATEAEKLVRLAHDRYRIGMSDSGDPFAVPHDGPNIALMLRGSRSSFRASLARDYRRTFNATPNSSALSDAVNVLEGESLESTPEPVHIRIAQHEDRIVVDLGTSDGRAIEIRHGGWTIVDVSPVLFRRTALTGVIPEPERGGKLSQLCELMNVTESTWPLALGWLVAAFIPNIPRPIKLLGGAQGAGKSTTARMEINLIDPSPAPLRSQPRDEQQWAVTAAASWGLAIDNVSTIPTWWSDALCRVVTGDGWVGRKLYTDSDLAVLKFRRCVILTSIDAGALRGDLGERIMMIECERINDSTRRSEEELDRLFAERRATILGALLDLTAQVWAELPNIHLPELPRMADFANILAAMDSVLGTDALTSFLNQNSLIACEVVESDSVGNAVLEFMASRRLWNGTATELHALLRPNPLHSDGWPKRPNALSGRLRRLAEPLRKLGVEITFGRKGDSNRGKTIKIKASNGRLSGIPLESSSRSSISSGPCEGDAEWINASGRSSDDLRCDKALDHPAQNGRGAQRSEDSDGTDDADDLSPSPSVDYPDAKPFVRVQNIDLESANSEGLIVEAAKLDSPLGVSGKGSNEWAFR